MFSMIDICILIILSWLCVYSIVNRICTCVENKNMAKAYEATAKCGMLNLDDMKSKNENEKV